jgi:lysophospholipase L1-like esterase
VGADPVLLAKAETIRIMALGDSITAGVAAGGLPARNGGYRGALAALLAQRGYHAQFVGTRNDFSEAIGARAHEGWPGYVLRSYPSNPGPGQLYGTLARNAILSDQPDVVLLMAGTNDLLRLERGNDGYTLAHIINSMALVLDEIFFERPSVRVILAPVVSSPKIDECTLARFAGSASCGAPAAASLKSLVAAYTARGYRITYAAAMATAVPRDSAHFPDGIHPSGAKGYDAIASVWLDAIVSVTATGPEQPVARVDAR